MADVEDLDEVGDLVVERVVTLQVDEGIPIHVIPLCRRLMAQRDGVGRREVPVKPSS